MIVAERLGAKLAEPLNTATMLCEPAERKAVVSAACPKLSVLTVPIGIEPSKKVTLPDGTVVVIVAVLVAALVRLLVRMLGAGLIAAPVTVAVSRTVWPTAGAGMLVINDVVVAAATGGGTPIRKNSPMCRLPDSVNQIFPFGPTVIPSG
jgi:hypothetical protein